MKPLFRISAGCQLPVPVLGVDADGAPRVADGVVFIDLAEAVERSGRTAEELTQFWSDVVNDLMGPPIEEIVVDFATGEATPIDVTSLGDDEIYERARRRQRGDFTLDEWAEFLMKARASGYNTDSGEVFPKRATMPDKREEIVCVAKIEALERRVLPSAVYGGMNGPFYSDDLENWKIYWGGEKPPEYCKIELFRKGVDKPHVIVTSYDEYVKFEDEHGNPLPVDRFKRIKYCVSMSRWTRAKGFREVFRDVVGNVYIPEELPQSQPPSRRGAAVGPRPVDYAPDAEVGVDNESIYTESNCRSAMTAMGVPEQAQTRMIATARSTNPLGEDDSPDAFWGAIVSEAQRMVGGRRRSR